MRNLWPLVVLGFAGMGCGVLLDVADDPATVRPPAPGDAGGIDDDGGRGADGASDAAASPPDAAPDATCGDTSSDSDNCGACGRKCNLGGACVSGTCDRFVVFVTSSTMTGLFTLATADNECAARAKAGSLGGTFRAWMPGPGATPNRFTPAVVAPYHRTNGQRVAPQWPPGDTLEQPISYDEKAVNRPNALVWSELDGNGDVTGINNCLGWVNPGPDQQGGYGKASSTTSTWTRPGLDTDVQACNQKLAFYCVEKP